MLCTVDLTSKCGRWWMSVSSVGWEGIVPLNTTTHFVSFMRGGRMELQSVLVCSVMKGTEYFVFL